MASTSALNETVAPQQLNPRANVFILVNLGCEMLYVIDQRLKAQQIAADKSIQVIHDVTTVLLEPKFIDSLIIGSTHTNAQLLTVEHCKFMLNDIATCSLMRLDELSMDKLWNLMTMMYKWQLYNSRHQHHMLDITFRHLDAINKLYPDTKRHLLIDFTKNTLLDFWNSSGEEHQLTIYRTNKAWLQCFNTKISLLIRLGFQSVDGSFLRPVTAPYYQEFVQTIGENVYMKNAEIMAQRKEKESSVDTTPRNRIDQFADFLNITPASQLQSAAVAGGEDLQPINVKHLQHQFEKNLQQCNILFDDLEVKNGGSGSVASVSKPGPNVETVLDDNLFGMQSKESDAEFIHLQTTYNLNAETSGCETVATGGLNRQLLDLYSKIN